MSFRVRRVIMVNLGTPTRGVSRRITEIDPRGGAAVIGPNGVGKTTTLRLLPLFYGALPSTLVNKSSGQSGMIPFVLPTPRSALAIAVLEALAPHDQALVDLIDHARMSPKPHRRRVAGRLQRRHHALRGGARLEAQCDVAEHLAGTLARATANTRLQPKLT